MPLSRFFYLDTSTSLLSTVLFLACIVDRENPSATIYTQNPFKIYELHPLILDTDVSGSLRKQRSIQEEQCHLVWPAESFEHAEARPHTLTHQPDLKHSD